MSECPWGGCKYCNESTFGWQHDWQEMLRDSRGKEAWDQRTGGILTNNPKDRAILWASGLIGHLESQLTEAQELLLIEYEKVNCLDSEIDNLKDRLAEREWISVSERLPEEFGWYFVIDEFLGHDKRTMGFYEGDGATWLAIDCREQVDEMRVTHWMSLPGAPNEKG